MLSSCAGAYHPEMLRKHFKDFESGKIDFPAIKNVQEKIQIEAWQKQQDIGIDLISLNDVFLTDPIHATLMILGLVPWGEEAYLNIGAVRKLWFNTSIMCNEPSIDFSKNYKPAPQDICALADLARSYEINGKPSLVGPLTLMAWCRDKETDKPCIDQWQKILPLYIDVLKSLSDCGVTWVQFDEPVLTYKLPSDILTLGHIVYQSLNEASDINIMLGAYANGMGENLRDVMTYAVKCIHIDLISNPEQYTEFLDNDHSKIFSLGVVGVEPDCHTNIQNQLKLVERSVNQIGLRRTFVSINSPAYYRTHNEQAGDETFDEKLRYLTIMARAMNVGKSSVAQEIEQNAKKLHDKKMV